MQDKPLAEKMRPLHLEEVVGQDHLVKDGKILYRIVKENKPTNIILWGPPGTGKTTLARIIANDTSSQFYELSAVNAAKSDVKKIIEQARINLDSGQKTVLFVDEIHRFNKAQQDAFLPVVEDGTIVLIGATTENPSFEVINPLLSRSRVLILQPLEKQDLVKVLKRAVLKEKISPEQISEDALNLIAEISGGDARVALGNLELAKQLAGKSKITEQLVTTAAQKKLPSYDKKGEDHYNVISAFIKSLRGSDVNASLYYMARMLQAGEDPKFIARRMIIFASEDIGIEASAALNLAVSTFLAVERIGLPECEYNLFHCAVALAKCKKSRSVAGAMLKAKKAAEEYPDLLVPLQVRNAPTKLMKNLGYGKDYHWKSNFKPKGGFLPSEIQGIKIYED